MVESNRRSVDRHAAFERHLGTIIGALILGAIIWVGGNVTDNIETTARTDVRLSNIEANLKELKRTVNIGMDDRWRRRDALEVQKANDERFDRLDSWASETEKRLDRLEVNRSLKN